MSISISSQVLGTLSVTIAETTGTLDVAVLSTAPAVLSMELGTPGPAATITVGTTTTLSPGSSATVTNAGTALAAILDFGIPKGEQGIQGPAGSSGVVYATSPLSYNSGTQTISIDLSDYATIASLGTAAYQPTSYWIQSPAVSATDGQIPAWDASTSRPIWIDNSARTLFLVGVNKTGSTIPKGSAVYVSGGTGGTPEISLAKADAELTSSRTIGVTTASIANNSQGNVVVGGLATKLDTSAYTEGQILYLSATTAGGFTTSLPTQPLHGVVIGYVTRSNSSNGSIEVAIQNYQELGELSDVLLSSKTNLDLLSWDSLAGVWKNKSFSTLGLATQAWVNAQGYLTSGALSPYVLRVGSSEIEVYGAQVKSYDGSDNYVSLNQGILSFGNGVTPAEMEISQSGITFPDSSVQTTAGIPDAPFDSQTYGRNNGAWVVAGSSSSVAWGSITGTLSSQTDLDSALSAKYDASNPAGYIDSSALSGYLTSSTAASTYAPLASPTFTGTVTIPAGASISGYLTTSSAASTYLTIANAASTYQTISGMSSYLTTAAASSTYETQTHAASTYYLQTNPAGYITSSALSPYLTSATAASTYYLQSNPSGYITSSALTGYAPLASPSLTGTPTAPTATAGTSTTQIATTAFVQGQGFVTASTAPVTSVAGRTGAVTLAVADVSGAAPTASPALTGVPTAPTASVGTNTTQIATTAFVLANAGSGGGGVDVQTFGSSTTSGTFTNGWTKPAGAKWVRVICFAAGSGGGSGARYATTSGRSGGTAGGGGQYVVGEFDAATLPPTVTVTVPAGGNGGSSQTANSTNGNAGSAGGMASFGTYLTTASAAAVGAGGGTTSGSNTSTITNYSTLGGSAIGFTAAGGAGIIGTGSTGGTLTLVSLGTTGGGGGAGQAANVTTSTFGGSGGYRSSTIVPSTTAASGGGGTGSTAASDGLDATFLGWGGMGGGGGGYKTGVAGQNGGIGGFPGGGGGGGSASDNGFASGAGGKGGNGTVIVITFF